ncbi:DUF983 domain-containing protein [Novosphingobium umbonatum]|uniref:DUF983 domain-containing protein n=1 Tax=Novosphingobium umbonatum TaxID=1908524 RepID=A0A3S2UUB1_9SPHN|nr:DUF983 domain-containing protein [Novosphingobium umbonatum]RVU07119.1 DUF983 domain-containing protein [Novosphingobium umbonatum]
MPAAPPALARVALLGLCPRCGAKGLFAGLAHFAPACKSCGMDFASFNVGDGPAAFLTFAVGGLAAVVAAWLALSVDPPVWVYPVVLVPLVFGPTLYGLRVGKAALLAAEYQRRAGEHRADPSRQDAS